MKPYLTIQCALLVAALLFSQVVSAFALIPAMQMQNCDMDMASAKDAAHSNARSDNHNANEMHAIPINDESNHESNHEKMNCCEMGEPMECCNAECQCSSLVASNLFINQFLNLHKNTKSNTAIEYYTSALSQPYLHSPKRPPILFS